MPLSLHDRILMKQLEKTKSLHKFHTFSSLYRKPHHHHHLFSLTPWLDFPSAHTVEREPVGSPLGKITSWLQSEDLLNGSVSKHSSEYLSYTTLKLDTHFCPNIISHHPQLHQRVQPFPQQMSKSILNSEGRKNSALKVLSSFFKDGLFCFHRHINFPKLLHKNNFGMTSSILNY